MNEKAEMKLESEVSEVASGIAPALAAVPGSGHDTD